MHWLYVSYFDYKYYIFDYALYLHLISYTLSLQTQT